MYMRVWWSRRWWWWWWWWKHARSGMTKELGSVSWEVVNISFRKIGEKNTLLKLLPHLSGANELMPTGRLYVERERDMGCTESGTLVHQFNTLRPRQDGRHFADDIFKCIFLMKMLEFRLLFHWSLFPRAINNIPAMVQLMAWRRPGDKPISG